MPKTTFPRRRGPVRSVARVLPLALVVAATSAMLASPAGVALAAGGPPAPKHALIIPNGGAPYGKAAKAGYLPGSAEVSSSGAFTYNVPLKVPDGRAGMAPQLSLNYSSAGGDGPFGLGWSLGGAGSSIGRCGKSPDTEGVRSGVHLDKDDRYCLDGQKLIALGAAEPGGSGQYGDHVTEYRTEADTFAQIVSVNDAGSAATVDTGPDRFVVLTKDGRIRTYEAKVAQRGVEAVSLTQAQEMPTPGGYCVNTTEGPECATTYYGQPVLTQSTEYTPVPPRVLWLLTEEKDRSENAIRYEYDSAQSTDGQEYRLGRIRYTFGPGRSASRTVELSYEFRPDPSFSYLAGVRFKQTMRVKSISMHAPNPGAVGLVRRYDVSYLPVGPGQRSRSLLSKVQECGALGGCLPAKQFVWAPGVAPSFTTSSLGGAGIDPSSPPTLAPQLHVLDMDGDGTDDVVYSRGGTTQQWAQLGWRNSAGAVSPLADFRLLSGQGAWPSTGLEMGGSRPLDVDGDGSTEFVARTGRPGHDRVLRWDAGSHRYLDAGINLNVDTAWDDFGDINGDGLLDRFLGVPTIESGDGDGPHANWNKLLVAVQLNRGTSFDPPVVSNADGNCPRRVADVDGDGRAELLVDQGFELPWPSTSSQPRCGLGAATFLWSGEVVRALKVDDAGNITQVSGQTADLPGAPDRALRLPFVNPQRDRWYWQPLPFLPLIHTYVNGLYGWHNELGDFNGDGLRDVLLVPRVKNADGNWERRGAILWNTGTGLSWNGTMLDLAHDQLADLRIGDVNNDGRDDVVSFFNAGLTVEPGPDGTPDTADDQVLNGAGNHDQIAVYLSKGSGTFTATTMNVTAGLPHTNPTIGRPFSQLGDFNGDGRLDIVKNDGQMRVMTQDPAQPERITAVKDEGAGWQRTAVVYSNSWTDHSDLMDDVPPCIAPLMCLRRGMTVVRSLTSHENVFASLEDYDSTTAFYSYADPVLHLRHGFLGFGTVRSWSPDRPRETTTVYDKRSAAAGGKYYPFGSTPKQVTTVVPILTPDQVAKQPATAQARVTRTASTPEFRPLNNGATYTVLPDKSTTDVWEQPVTISWATSSAGTHVGGIPDATPANPANHVEESFDHDGFANLTYHKSATAGGVTEEASYGYDLSDPRREVWLISLGTTTEITRSEADGTPGPVTRRSENRYDGQGRLDTVWVEKGGDPDVQLTTSYGLDPTGVVRTVTTSAPNRPDRVDHTEYTPVFPGQPDEQIYPSQLWSEHDQLVNGQHDTTNYRPSSWQAVHPAFGLTVATEDINGVSTATYHDDLGRPVLATADGKPSVATGYQQHINTQGDMAGLKVRSVTYLGPVGTPNATVHVAEAVADQLGRTRIATTSGFDGTAITTTGDYDSLGRQVSQSRPYLYGAAAPGFTTSVFDSLDRPRETRLPNNTTKTWSYSGLFTTDAYDTDNGQTRTITDVNGRTGTVIQYHNTAPAGSPPVVIPIATTYDYAPFDQVRTITDDHGNVTEYGYDVRGRTISASDPDRGPLTTTYFGTGEVHKTKHSCAGTSCTSTGSGNDSGYTYDDLGRNTTRVDHDAATGQNAVTTFGYDTAANGIGQLDYADSPDSIRTRYRYDTLGRRIGTDYTDQLSNVTRSTDTNYDWLGRLDTVAYPTVPGRARLTVKTGYNGKGYPDTVTDVTAGQPPSTLWRALSRNADLALTGAFLGQPAPGGLQIPPLGQSRLYDDTTGRLTDITTVQPNGTKVQNLAYTYYDNGQVHTRTQADTTATRTESYDYDDLHRLKIWNLTNGTSPTVTSGYVYDTIGNLTGILGNHGEARTIGRQDGTLPHALTAHGNESYDYDAQGRLVQINSTNQGQTTVAGNLTYTAFDLPRTQTATGQGSWTYRYDAFGTRVSKAGPDGGVFYLPGLFEDRTGPTGAHTYAFHLSGPDGAIGQALFDGTGTTLTFTLTDALGSTGTSTTGTGTPNGSYFYEPYGARINPDGSYLFGFSGNVHQGFTGHEHDDALGQINMKGRIYSPALKTFFTPDPVTSNHPYTYVNSNPTNATDPTGYDDDCFICENESRDDSANNAELVTTANPLPEYTPYNPADQVCGSTYVAPCLDTPANTGSDTAGYQPVAKTMIDELDPVGINTFVGNVNIGLSAVGDWWSTPEGTTWMPDNPFDPLPTALDYHEVEVTRGDLVMATADIVLTLAPLAKPGLLSSARAVPAGNGGSVLRTYPIDVHQPGWAQELIHEVRGSAPRPCGDLCGAVFKSLDGAPTAARTSTPYMTPAQMVERLGLPEGAARPAMDGFAGVAQRLQSMGEGSHAAVIGVYPDTSVAHWFNATYRDGGVHVVDAFFGGPGPETLFTENMWVIFGSGH